MRQPGYEWTSIGGLTADLEREGRMGMKVMEGEDAVRWQVGRIMSGRRKRNRGRVR